MNNFIISIIVFILLLILWFFGLKVTCFSLFFIIIYSVIIFISDYKIRLIERKCFAKCYLKENSFLYKLFNKKFISFVVSFFNSVILSTSLALFVIQVSKIDILELMISIAISMYIYNYLFKIKVLKENLSNFFYIKISSFLSAFIIAFIFVFIKIEFTLPPSFIDNSLMITIKNASYQVYSNCNFINYIAKLFQEIDAFKWWFLLKFSIDIHNFYVKFLIWIIFLFGNILALLSANKLFLTLLILFKEFRNGRE